MGFLILLLIPLTTLSLLKDIPVLHDVSKLTSRDLKYFATLMNVKG